MRTYAPAMIAVALAAAVPAVALQSRDPLPPGHPPVTTAPAAPEEIPAARPDDVGTAGAIVAAYYDAMSGPVGAPRDWGRFQSLFLPQAHLATVIGGDAHGAPLVLTPAQFVRMNRQYFEGSGYDERSIHERVDEFGHVAHVLSTYEARRNAAPEPYARGLNSFQLLRSGGRWWIVSVIWDRERPDAPLRPEHLPGGAPPHLDG